MKGLEATQCHVCLSHKPVQIQGEGADFISWEEYQSLMVSRACRTRDVVASLGKIQSVLRLNQEANYEASCLKGSSVLLNFGRALKWGSHLFTKGLDCSWHLLYWNFGLLELVSSHSLEKPWWNTDSVQDPNCCGAVGGVCVETEVPQGAYKPKGECELPLAFSQLSNGEEEGQRQSLMIVTIKLVETRHKMHSL